MRYATGATTVDAVSVLAAKAGPGAHSHFRDRLDATIARRRFLQLGVGSIAGAAVLSSGVGGAAVAWADGDRRRSITLARPVPGGFALPGGPTFHVFDVVAGKEPSTVFDFDGVTALAHHQGTGVGIDTRTHVKKTYQTDSDMRFMQGRFVGTDGKTHHGTFGFI
jgi:hypothetical protein